MKFLKHTCVKFSLVGLMALSLTACGSKEEAGKVTEKATTESVVITEENVTTTEANAKTTESNITTTEANVTTTEVATTEANATTTEDTTESSDTSKDEAIITVDEAIELVREQMGEDYSYIPEDELEERDGSQYYVIHVKMLLEQGTMTTMTTYMVKTDGSELFDIYAVDYYGEYVRTYDSGESTFVVSEDGTFEMTTGGEVNQVTSGYYKVGITNSASVVKLFVYPNKVVVDGEEQVMENVEGTAVIEGDVLTLTMESEPTEYTKR